MLLSTVDFIVLQSLADSLSVVTISFKKLTYFFLIFDFFVSTFGIFFRLIRCRHWYFWNRIRRCLCLGTKTWFSQIQTVLPFSCCQDRPTIWFSSFHCFAFPSSRLIVIEIRLKLSSCDFELSCSTWLRALVGHFPLVVYIWLTPSSFVSLLGCADAFILAKASC